MPERVAAGAGVREGSRSCRGVAVQPGDDVQQRLDDSADGATICFGAGTYRLTAPLQPADDQRLVAERGAVLTGAAVVRGWRRQGSVWSARRALPEEPYVHGECAEGTLCRYAETVFVDGGRLRRVGSRDRVGPGTFWADYRANEVWIGDRPTGHRVEIARADAAINGRATGVVVDGFVIERFANAAQHGAIHTGVGWTIEHNEVRANHGTGIHATAGRVLHNHIHHNGQLGLLGTGDGLLVEGNEIDHNNTQGFWAIWEAGGTKFARTDGLVVRGNDVHHNSGPGLWTDINNIDTLIERNLVHANTSHGIFHEISYAAVIRFNRVTGNGRSDPQPGWGGAGIRIAASRDVEVHDNVVVGNHNGVMLIQQRRTDWPSPHGAHIVQNVDVHDNTITLGPDRLTGLVDDTGSSAAFGRGIRFDDNTYQVPSRDIAAFAWRGTEWDPTAWRRRFDQDGSSTFVQA